MITINGTKWKIEGQNENTIFLSCEYANIALYVGDK